jgi:hypothetical protein
MVAGGGAHGKRGARSPTLEGADSPWAAGHRPGTRHPWPDGSPSGLRQVVGCS